MQPTRVVLRVRARGTAARPSHVARSASVLPSHPRNHRRPTLAHPKLSQASISSRPPLFLVHPFFPKFGPFPPCLLSHHRSSTCNIVFLTSPSYLLSRTPFRLLAFLIYIDFFSCFSDRLTPFPQSPWRRDRATGQLRPLSLRLRARTNTSCLVMVSTAKSSPPTFAGTSETMHLYALEPTRYALSTEIFFPSQSHPLEGGIVRNCRLQLLAS